MDGNSPLRHFDTRLLGFAAVILISSLVLTFLNSSRFLSLANFQSMAFQMPEYGMLSLAMTFAIVSGGIDLSIVQITVLSGILAGKTIEMALKGGLPTNWVIMCAILVCLMSSAVFGITNGFLIGYRNLEPILVTLGTSQVFLGISTIATKGGAITNYPAQFVAIGNNTVLGVPIILLIFILVAAACSFILRRTRFGFNIYMIGTNKKVSIFSGVNTKKVLLLTYALAGALAGTASFIVMARTNSIRVGYGDSYLLLSVLVAILGGVSPTGGSGKISGIVLSIILLQIVSSGFNLLGYSAFLKNAFWGMILVLVMIINFYNARRQYDSGGAS
jgi:simple sugar transport system permease protein